MLVLIIFLKIVFVGLFVVKIDLVSCNNYDTQQHVSELKKLNPFFHTWDVETSEIQSSSGNLQGHSRQPDSTASISVPETNNATPGVTHYGETTIKSVGQEGFESLKRTSYRPNFLVETPPTGPPLIDWRKSTTYPRVHNQHQFRWCACCWAISSVGVLEILYSRMHGTGTLFSYQQLIDCCPNTNGCNGGHIVPALGYMVETGVTLEETYPYIGRKNKCRSDFEIVVKVKGFRQIDNNEEAMVQALRQSPLAIALHSPPEIRSYEGGVINPPSCKNSTQSCNHAVVIVGHGKDYWIIRNSWGETFGDSGHYLLRKGTCAVGNFVWSVTLASEGSNGLTDASIRSPSIRTGISSISPALLTRKAQKLRYLKRLGIC